MAGELNWCYFDHRCLVRFFYWKIVVVVCTSPFHFSSFRRFSDLQRERCHRCNAVHLHLVLTPGLDDSPVCKITGLLIKKATLGIKAWRFCVTNFGATTKVQDRASSNSLCRRNRRKREVLATVRTTRSRLRSLLPRIKMLTAGSFCH